MARLKLPDFTGEVRPIAISLICILGIIFNVFWAIALIQLPHTSYQNVIDLGFMVGPIPTIQSLLSIIAYIGIFRMKWWGLILFIIINVAFYLYGALYAQASLISIIIHAIVCIIFLIYCRKMD